RRKFGKWDRVGPAVRARQVGGDAGRQDRDGFGGEPMDHGARCTAPGASSPRGVRSGSRRRRNRRGRRSAPDAPPLARAPAGALENRARRTAASTARGPRLRGPRPEARGDRGSSSAPEGAETGSSGRRSLEPPAPFPGGGRSSPPPFRARAARGRERDDRGGGRDARFVLPGRSPGPDRPPARAARPTPTP